jgi:hypothetical protein
VGDTFSRKGRRIVLAVLSALLLVSPALAETLTLKGVMTAADHQTYREVPFKVPPGTTAVTVDFAYTGKDQKAVIDLGVRDPQRFRGWSGGAKARFTLTETWATPSYLPGPLPAGAWKLILGVPNLRKDGRAEYTATVTLDRSPVFHGFAAAPLKAGPGWYRGDLHMHTGHSDGSCATRTGKRAPCPVFRTAEAAAARGLDFIAVTDHNTTSQAQALADLQPYFDDLLLIPGEEITTFRGHLNVLGVVRPLDFQLLSPRLPSLEPLIEEAKALNAVVVANHPGLPSGEACMGCGWTMPGRGDPLDAVEVVNGAVAGGPLSGFGLWEQRLGRGEPVTAVGGSDNHDPGLSPERAIGRPTTVVHADNLSQDAILAAIRAGHVFVDTQGTRDRMLDVRFESAGRVVEMGDRADGSSGGRLTAHVTHAAGGHIVLTGPSAPKLKTAPLGDDDTFALDLPPGAHGWLRMDVVGPDGALWLLGNPIYLDPEP